MAPVLCQPWRHRPEWIRLMYLFIMNKVNGVRYGLELPIYPSIRNYCLCHVHVLFESHSLSKSAYVFHYLLWNVSNSFRSESLFIKILNVRSGWTKKNEMEKKKKQMTMTKTMKSNRTQNKMFGNFLCFFDPFRFVSLAGKINTKRRLWAADSMAKQRPKKNKLCGFREVFVNVFN